MNGGREVGKGRVRVREGREGEEGLKGGGREGLERGGEREGDLTCGPVRSVLVPCVTA